MTAEPTGEHVILIFWLCWLLPISLSGLLVFGIHYTENYAFIGVGACGSAAAMVAYFIGNRHRVDDVFEQEDLEIDEMYYVLWKDPQKHSCVAVIRDKEGRLLTIKLSEAVYNGIEVDQKFGVVERTSYAFDGMETDISRVYVAYRYNMVPIRIA